MKLFIVLVIAFNLTGCATYKQEYSRIRAEQKARQPQKQIPHEAYLAGNNSNAACQIALNASEGNSGASATVLIKNLGNVPFRTNQFTDKFFIASNDGKVYELDAVNDSQRYESETLNPGAAAQSYFSLQYDNPIKGIVISGNIHRGQCILGLAQEKIEIQKRDPETGKLV